MQTNSIDRWKMTLAVLFGLFLAGMLITFSVAAHRVSRVVDADYYSHGLHYGKTGNGSANPGMGWTMNASVAGGKLQVCVTDQAGSPVCGGKLHFQPEPRKATAPTFALVESRPGVFTARDPLSHQGELRGTLLFTRGDAVATHRMVLFN